MYGSQTQIQPKPNIRGGQGELLTEQRSLTEERAGAAFTAGSAKSQEVTEAEEDGGPKWCSAARTLPTGLS
ncbi:hypothetical protein ILYODFUR_024787 [Ilyodon furcidens]|uniref:Uncharacterized protein n=1 Tax=Ilyodon furcidens TaxID=33524 RepID=A0ABV0TLE2_9TELE